MTKNYVKKECPRCGKSPCDIQGAIVKYDKGERVSFNRYTCGSCHNMFLVKRKGDKVEQALTEKFITSESIFL